MRLQMKRKCPIPEGREMWELRSCSSQVSHWQHPVLTLVALGPGTVALMRPGSSLFLVFWSEGEKPGPSVEEQWGTEARHFPSLCWLEAG